jgi:hypothetical protein
VSLVTEGPNMKTGGEPLELDERSRARKED